MSKGFEKLTMESTDKVLENVEIIGKLFPNTLTEVIKGYDADYKPIIEKAIDFDILRQELSNVLVEGPAERYQMNWPDKRKSILLANTPTNMTLRPCREESVDFDTTQNIYIEGNNLEVLKLLQETYLNKVKMIYIDPPYNTGNDSFVYDDNFKVDEKTFSEMSGKYDEEGNIVFDIKQNNEDNGRYHTDWMNMIYPRLKLSKDLLTDNGVIFISTGDIELANIVKMCDEVFGGMNQVGIVPRLMKSGGNKGKFFSPNIDYVLVYAKNIFEAEPFKGELDENLVNKLYNKVETEGERKGERYRPFGLYQSSLDARPNQRYYIECPDGTFAIPPGKTFPVKAEDGCKVLPESTDGCWRWSVERYKEEKLKGNIIFVESKKGVLIKPDGNASKWNIYTKIWLANREEEGQTPTNFISKFENRHSAKELSELDIPFGFAKPTNLIKYLISLLGDAKDAIICDFFAGSSTTAHAVMQLNAEDGGKRQFIMVQLEEETPEKSEARKAGYETICEIGKERIRRAGRKIKEENPDTTQDLDIGFRVLKLDSSNMKDVYYKPVAYRQASLDDMGENIKEGRTSEDLLFQVMLELGELLSSDIEQKVIAGKTVYSVGQGNIMACFDEDVTDEVVIAIAKERPYYAVFRDSSIASDSVAANFEQIFQTYSPTTVRKVL